MKSGDAINIDSDDELNPFEGIKPFLFSCLPLIALFVLKFTFQHFNDGLLLLGLNLVAFKLNSSVVRQVQLKQDSSTIKCIYLALLVIISIVCSLFTFQQLQIWKCLYMVPLGSGDYGLGLVWLVIYTDSLLKLLAVAVKLFIVPLSPKFINFYRRGCLFSGVEYGFCALRYFIPGMQLAPYVLSVIDGDSVRELYFSYLVYFLFIGFKLYFAVKEFRKILYPVKLFYAQPNFGERENKTIACDLAQKVVNGQAVTFNNRHGIKSYCEEDLLHWMASYGTCPETGIIHSTLAFGNGHTRMNVNLF